MGLQVITLLSAQGITDVSISAARASLGECAPGAVIVDISHTVKQNDLRQAAYILSSAYPHFPQGTIHLAPVHIFSDRPYRILLAQADGFYFIAPDNGFIPLLLGAGIAVRSCGELPVAANFAEWIKLSGIAVRAIINDDLQAFAMYTSPIVPQLQAPLISRDSIDCTVLYVDRFGNVVLDISKEQFAALIGEKPFRISLLRSDDITGVSANYNDVPLEKSLCRFNTAGFLEIAFNHGNAATILGLRGDSDASIRYRKIKIVTSGN